MKIERSTLGKAPEASIAPASKNTGSVLGKRKERDFPSDMPPSKRQAIGTSEPSAAMRGRAVLNKVENLNEFPGQLAFDKSSAEIHESAHFLPGGGFRHPGGELYKGISYRPQGGKAIHVNGIAHPDGHTFQVYERDTHKPVATLAIVDARESNPDGTETQSKVAVDAKDAKLPGGIRIKKDSNGTWRLPNGRACNGHGIPIKEPKISAPVLSSYDPGPSTSRSQDYSSPYDMSELGNALPSRQYSDYSPSSEGPVRYTIRAPKDSRPSANSRPYASSSSHPAYSRNSNYIPTNLTSSLSSSVSTGKILLKGYFSDSENYSKAFEMYSKADQTTHDSLLRKISGRSDVGIEIRSSDYVNDQPGHYGITDGTVAGLSMADSSPRELALAIQEGYPLALGIDVNPNLDSKGEIAHTLNHEISVHAKAHLNAYDAAKNRFKEGQSVSEVASYLERQQSAEGGIGIGGHLSIAGLDKNDPSFRTKLFVEVNNKMMTSLSSKSKTRKELGTLIYSDVKNQKSKFSDALKKLNKESDLDSEDRVLRQEILSYLPEKKTRSNR